MVRIFGYNSPPAMTKVKDTPIRIHGAVHKEIWGCNQKFPD